ncbi:hypothetical protein ACFFX0_27165 [Citricoccus parietis]|uniref:Uncharacterized protein n=1 Tax=Citricoccus parietis TaxID=592307 RepID=A0ABV5G6V2_9MICC
MTCSRPWCRCGPVTGSWPRSAKMARRWTSTCGRSRASPTPSSRPPTAASRPGTGESPSDPAPGSPAR